MAAFAASFNAFAQRAVDELALLDDGLLDPLERVDPAEGASLTVTDDVALSALLRPSDGRVGQRVLDAGLENERAALRPLVSSLGGGAGRLLALALGSRGGAGSRAAVAAGYVALGRES